MINLENLKTLRNFLVEIQHISSATSLLGWDQETYMPSGASEARAELLSSLMTLAHKKFVSSEMEDHLSRWLDLKTGEILETHKDEWDPMALALLREVWRDYSKSKRLPSEFVGRMGKETSLALHVWTDARKKSDFSIFKKTLSVILDLKKEEANLLGFSESPYDALLDTYEPGTKVSHLIPLFEKIKSRLVPLLEKVLHSSKQPDNAFLFQSFDTGKQLAFGERVLRAMGYDLKRGRQDLSQHPFTTSFHPTDVRITTRVYEKDLQSALFGSIHEGGHALYEQGLDDNYFGTPLGEPISLGIHESQSRLWENCVGRSLVFWKHFFPLLQETFPNQLGKIDIQTFYKAINKVKPSLIRVEADELTYNLHIMIRFEIEKDLIEGIIGVDDIPFAWDIKMQSYLGISPEKDSDGPLQDIHWAHGSFGYFPTYTLGNLYSLQFFNQAKKDNPNLLAEIEKGNLLPLKQWLNQKIHRWGRTFPSDALAKIITGEELNPDYFLDYLEEKTMEIYQ